MILSTRLMCRLVPPYHPHIPGCYRLVDPQCNASGDFFVRVSSIYETTIFRNRSRLDLV